MIYLDNAATTLHKPEAVRRKMAAAAGTLANPGRSGHAAAMAAGREVYACREQAAALFDAQPEQICFTLNATHALNIAIHTLVPEGASVVISGYEHNAVTRPLFARKAQLTVAGTELFQPALAIRQYDAAIRPGTAAVIVNHVSNVFGYIQPLREIAEICSARQVPLLVDASQSAGVLPISLRELGAAFIAMPGHKALYGPQGTGILLCGQLPAPLLQGGTGSMSESREMPDFLPDRVEAGTLNVPGICGLCEGLRYVRARTPERILSAERALTQRLAEGLRQLPGIRVFADAAQQAGVLSFCPPHIDCEEAAERFAKQEIAVRAGLHCAPLAHRSAGTAQTGTVRVSLSAANRAEEIDRFLAATRKMLARKSLLQ